MSADVTVEREIAASPDAVWALISDVTRMGEFSPENMGGRWMGKPREPVVGARFRGTNENGKRQWKTVCSVVTAEPGRAFAFDVKAAGLKIARWEYRFDPTESGGCRVAETWIDHRGKLATWLGGPVSGVRNRESHNRAGMVVTLERLAAVAEGTRA